MRAQTLNKCPILYAVMNVRRNMQDGNTPLTIAARIDKADLVETLLEWGARVDKADSSLLSPDADLATDKEHGVPGQDLLQSDTRNTRYYSIHVMVLPWWRMAEEEEKRVPTR
eukprot:1137662-Pelagomonas_calceolata.AAC.1